MDLRFQADIRELQKRQSRLTASTTALTYNSTQHHLLHHTISD